MPFPRIDFMAPVIRAAIKSLQAGMPGQVAQFNGEGGVQIGEPDDASYFFGGCDLLAAASMPVIEVAATDGRMSALSLGQQSADHAPTVNVAIWVEGEKGDFTELYEQSLGLARCVLEVLVQPDAFGPTCELDDLQPVYWRADALPTDFTADNRDFKRWRTPVFMQYRLQLLEQFA